MSTDPAHVTAVAEAMLGVKIPDDLPLDVEPIEVERFFATVAVETLTPLIRAQVAAEIRAGCLAAGDGWREGRARTDLCTACAASARIAEGTP